MRTEGIDISAVEIPESRQAVSHMGHAWRWPGAMNFENTAVVSDRA
jgi:hypothetical protein